MINVLHGSIDTAAVVVAAHLVTPVPISECQRHWDKAT